MPRDGFAQRLSEWPGALARTALLAFALLELAFGCAAAQSRQRWSLQGSGEWVFPRKDYGGVLQSGSNLGWEAQLRHTFGRLSLGAGYQRSIVFRSAAADLTGTLGVAFLEPRYVVAVVGEHLAPYIAARLGAGTLFIRGTSSSNQRSVTYGGGAGVLLAVAPRVSIDLGGQYFVADFGGSGGSAGYLLARVGLAIGLF